jgi:hypothetical protein
LRRVATNDKACETSYLVAALSGEPGTRSKYRIGFSVADPGAKWSAIFTSLPLSQM